MNILQKALSGIAKAFDTSVDSFSTWISTVNGKISKFKLLKLYKNLVYSCVSVIATDVAKYEPLFYRKNPKGEKVYIDHGFKTVMENPNPDMSQYDLMEATQSYLELTGDSYWYLAVGELSHKPKEIYMMRPDLVDTAKDKNGKTIGYVFNKSSEVKVPLELYEVIHFKTFNPIDPDHGLSAVEAGLLYVQTENSTSEFQKNFMENQASPSGVLSLNGKIGKETFNKIKKQWREANSGLQNVGKTLIIRNTDASFQKVGLSIADIDMASLKGITDSRVRGIFKVPKALLGDADSSGLGRSNVEALEYNFAKRVTDPKQIKLDDAIRLAIRRIYNDKTVYVEHVSQVPQDDAKKLQYQQAAVNKWKTINEVRAMDGDKPVKGGDSLYVPFSDIAIDEPPAASNETQPQKIVIRMDTDKKQSEECECGHVHNSVDNKKKIKKADDGTVRYVNILEKLRLRLISPYKKTLAPYLDDQKKRVIELLQSATGGKSVLPKDTVNKFIDQLVDEVNDKGDIELLLEKLVALLFGAYEKSGVKGVEFLGKPDVKFVSDQAARDYIFASTERQLKSFDEQTAIKIQQQMAQGLAAGEDTEQLTKRIESIYEDAKGFRAKRIAETESHKAVNYGSAQSYIQSGVRKMKWYAFDSACDFCKAMAGTIVEIGKPFIPKGGSVSLSDGSEFIADYEDVSYGDLHPNCNCKLLPA